MTRTVRTTMQPDRDIEVGDADYLDLQRQGLLLPDVTKTDTAAPATPAAPSAPDKKTSSTAKSS